MHLNPCGRQGSLPGPQAWARPTRWLCFGLKGGIERVRCLLTMTTANLEHVENRKLLLGRSTARERVAALLLEMNGHLTAASVIALPMSRRDIADYLGLTLEKVSRELSTFQRKGYLRFLDHMQRQIVVLNATGLTKLDAPRDWLRRPQE